MTKAPKFITVCNLEVVVMPNGEVICSGGAVGWESKIGKFLTIKPEYKRKVKL